MAHTAMQFTFAEFDKNFTRGGTVQYTATAPAQLIVVAESSAGIKTTYWFKIPKGEVVLVSMNANLIYIPVRCAKREAGDKTDCG